MRLSSLHVEVSDTDSGHVVAAGVDSADLPLLVFGELIVGAESVGAIERLESAVSRWREAARAGTATASK